MNILRKILLTLFALPVRLLVRSKDIPLNISELGLDPAKPVIYLLPSNSVTDQLALAISTRRLGLPKAIGAVTAHQYSYPSCLFLRKTDSIFFGKDRPTKIAGIFTTMFGHHRENEELDVQIVPVYITWGRAPGKGKPGLLSAMAATAAPSWLKKFFIVLLLGRDTFVNYSKAVSTRFMAEQRASDAAIAQKLVRLANTHFYRKRQAIAGPTLIEKQARNNAILGSESVRTAMSEQANSKNQSIDTVRKSALDYIQEIAADYSEGQIRFGDRVLTFIWNKIYNGISVGHADRLRELARNGHEIVYVPCHRSHMDYLLLTYVIYHEGLVTPHIAAGLNLSFWPMGPVARRGGAFFLRRSFAGNKLYTAVFREYLQLLFNRGYSVKYFPEGGRSRTGRLLPPKTGMMAMTLQALLKGINRPISIVPVYIGYENVMEVKSYQKELKGKVKRKESPGQIFSALRKLKNYGHAYVNFGKPVTLNQYLDEAVPDWRDTKNNADKKPAWLTPTVNQLATDVMTRVNTAAAINGMALTSLCLLSTRNHVLGKRELVTACADCIGLLEHAPYSDDVTLPKTSATNLINETLSLGRLHVERDDFGELISPFKDGAVLLTYYRNNILHLFALPGLITAKVFAAGKTEKSSIVSLITALYPLLQKELFLRHTLEEALAYCDALLAVMTQRGLIIQNGAFLQPPETTSAHYQSALLISRCMQETLQRYAVLLTVLQQHTAIARGDLERQSRTIAERLSTLYGISSPEFYDKTVFSTFTTALRQHKWINSDESGNLCLSEQSAELREDVLALIDRELVQHLAELGDTHSTNS